MRSTRSQTGKRGSAATFVASPCRVTIALAPIAIGLALVALRPVPPAQMPTNAPAPRYYGVNLASASFASNKKPGVHGKDYIYPTGKIAAPFAAMGMNTIRLPVLWERLQPTAFGPLREEELKYLDQSIKELSDFRTIIIDIHNYGRYFGAPLKDSAQGGPVLADLWSKLARRYKNNPRIAFGLMNEPHGIKATEWRKISDQSVKAIRKTGARNLVLVPGTRWTGGHSWNSGGADSNAAAMRAFDDPGRNMVFEIHQYLDKDSSGTSSKCVGPTIGRQRLNGVTDWLRNQRAKAVLAEFGVASNQECLVALDDLLKFLRANGDVWVGWTYWSAGDWWGKYPFNVQPEKGHGKPQGDVLRRNVASYRRAGSS